MRSSLPVRSPVAARALLPSLAALWVALPGCASSPSLSERPEDYGSSSARLAVQTFLDATARRDLQAMGRQFGTPRGPAEEQMGVVEVEQRMVVLAGLLRHRSYSLERRDLMRDGPGRARFIATLVGTGQGTVDVPLVAAVTREGRWFVERVEVDNLTR